MIFLLFLGMGFANAQNAGFQKMDWDNAPVNPVGFYNHKSHYKLKGDVMMYKRNYFDRKGFLLKKDFPVEAYFYDNHGRIIQTIDFHKVTYGTNNLVAMVVSPSGYIETFKYDNSGNLIEKNSGDSAFHTYTYDNLNRVVSAVTKDAYDRSHKTYSYHKTGDIIEVTITDVPSKKVVGIDSYKNGYLIKSCDYLNKCQTSEKRFDKNNNLLNANVTEAIVYYSDAPFEIRTITVANTNSFDGSATVYINGKEHVNNVLAVINANNAVVFLPQNNTYYLLKNNKYDATTTTAGITVVNAMTVLKLNAEYYPMDLGRFVPLEHNASDVLGLSMVFYFKMSKEHVHYFVDAKSIDNAGITGLIPATKHMDGTHVFYTKFPQGNYDIIDKGKLYEPRKYKISKNKDGSLMYLPSDKSMPTYFLNGVDKAVVNKIMPASSNEQINDFARRLEQELPKGYDVEKIMNSAKKDMYISEINQPNYTYYGQMVNNTYEGFGRYTWKSTGNFTIGLWEKNMREGLHIKRDANGTIQEAGMYVKDKLLSNQKWINNTEKTPGCIGDCINGFGELKTTDKHLYIGFFKNGKLDGIAIMLNENGSQYEGEVKNGLRHGYGDWYAKNGQVYHGNFENDRTNGYGILIEKDGTVRKGIFKDDKLVKAM